MQLNQADLIIDAILGTGVDRELRGYYAELVGWINHSPAQVLACDVPTGLNSDTGYVMGCCVRANLTVSFITLKAGLFTAQGKAQAGEIRFSNLGVSEQIYLKHQPIAQLINSVQLSKFVRKRSESAHKGNTGYVGIVGGAPGMLGAVLMAGEAAYRIGCGRVKVLTHAQHASQLALACPELMTQALEQTTDWNASLREFNALAIGPGLGQLRWSKQQFSQAVQSALPRVVDADGLNFLAQNECWSDNWILTPHPGEAARLLDCTSAEIQADRFAAIKEIVKRYGGVCVLKGSGSLIANGRLTCVCSAGNSGQATAGMGDILTGLIVGLLAQGYSQIEAAILGVWIHAAAADKYAAQTGKIGMMATDILAVAQLLHNELIDE